MSAAFDGSTYLRRAANLRGIESSKKLMISGWFKTEDGGGGTVFVGGGPAGATQKVSLTQSTSTGVLSFLVRDSSDTLLWQVNTDDAFDDAAWHHVAISVDLGNSRGQIYVDRTAADLTVSTALTDGTIAFASATEWVFGAFWNGASVVLDNTKWYDFLFFPGISLDLSDGDNLKYFVASDARTNADTGYEYQKYEPTGVKPVGYGHDFSFPSQDGTKPLVAFSGNFMQNRGTGGSFTLTGGFESQSSPDNPNAYRGAARWATPGQRWFDSEQSGFSYPRAETFVEDREGHPAFGKRMGLDERDESTRDVGPLRAESVSTLVRGGDEQDDEDTRWQP